MVCLSLLNVFLSVVPNHLSDNGTNLLYSLLAQIFCMGVIPLLGGTLTYWGKGGTVAERMSYTLRRWGYRAPKDKRVWLPVVLLSVSFIYVTQLVARIGNLALMLGQYTFPASGSYMYNNVGELLMWIAVGSLLPATFEELTHRGLVIDAIGDGGNEIEQMLLCGLLFALMHLFMQWNWHFCQVKGMAAIEAICLRRWKVLRALPIFQKYRCSQN